MSPKLGRGELARLIDSLESMGFEIRADLGGFSSEHSGPDVVVLNSFRSLASEYSDAFKIAISKTADGPWVLDVDVEG